MEQNQNVGILVGGGPAPGINGVISAVTLEARTRAHKVIGIYDGFQWLMRGDPTHTKELDHDDVSRVHFQGGSILNTSRANPTKNPQDLQHVVAAHLSEKNNTPELARAALSGALNCTMDWIGIATQEDGFAWRDLA